MINYTNFLKLLTDVGTCSDLDSYIDQCSSTVTMNDPQDAARLLTILWNMASGGLGIKQIAAACGISVRQIGIRYGIPQVTLEQ